MPISLFFNFSFDLALLALIIFIIWLGFQITKSKRTKSNHNLHHWLSVIIILLTISTMSLSYGGLQLTRREVNLPTQNRVRINLLRQALINAKRQASSPNSKATGSKSKRNSKNVTTLKANAPIKKSVAKRPVPIELRVRIKSVNPKRRVLWAQNNRQLYKIIQFKEPRAKAKSSVTIRGLATKVNHNIITVKNAKLSH